METGDSVNQTIKYEYLDHTADVQLHAWGDDMKEAFAQCAMSMYGYMTEIDSVNELTEQPIEVSGEDLISLLYQFLDECLFLFSTEPFFIARRVVVNELDYENYTLKATGYGEEFDLSKHPQGTEVKAITYSNMQAHEANSPESPDGLAHVFVVIDI
ncbi:protein archease-like [Watersipora subatra]|uniref:protein archease-like n=1 Tax=Watersipora subatra TaxID=2589382 RepID=UPI00355B274E